MALAQPLITPFVWGANGERMTPEEVARQRKVLDALMGRTDTSPVGHWTQGLARVVDAFGDKLQESRLNAAADKNAAENKSILSALLGSYGGGSFPAAPSSPSFPETPPTAHAAEHERDISLNGGAPLNMSGNEVFSGFMDTVKSGVSNPYALAAIAATGKHESGFDPKNATRTWSDPSQSGQPGQAGGIMSWRGPRYAALAAGGDLSPAGQAKFFLQENPQLITALNNARSVDEAVSLMNNAWKFAGYNRPGGEAAARLATARSLLPTFQGGAARAPVQVASLDPSIGLPDEQPQQAAGIFVGTPDEYAGSRLPAEGPIPQPSPMTAAAAQAPQPQPAPMQVAQALMPREAMSGAADAPMQAGGINPAIIEALSSPYADDNTRRIAGLLFQNQLEQQAAANDPMRALQMQKLQVEIDQALNPQMSFSDQIARDRLNFDMGQADLTTGIKDYNAYAADERAAGRQPLGRLEYEQAVRSSGATNITNVLGGEQLTPGQKKIDEAFADTYLAWNSGGFADSRKQIEQLGEAIKILESGENVTGLIGAMPPQLAPFFNKEGTIARENVEEVVQRSLREILGAQFTEKEGERLISRAFNPLLEPKENAKRVRRLLTTIGSMADAKQDMVDYFDQNGTLRGYRGSRPTVSQIEQLANEFGKSPEEKDDQRNRTSSGVEWSIEE